MKQLITFLLLIGLLCNSLVSFAQNELYQISIEGLSFHSEFEKSVLSGNLKENDAAYLFATSKNGTQEKFNNLKQSVANFALELEKKVKPNKAQKNLSLVCEAVNEEYLNYANEKTDLLSIVETGSYSKESAVLLYALVFKKLNIPYQIIQIQDIKEPNTTLVAYPQTKQLKINIGSKSELFLVIKTEIILEEMTFQKAASFVYYNEASMLYAKGEKDVALQYLKKASFLRRNELLQKQLVLMYREKLPQLDYEDYSEVKMLSAVVNYDTTFTIEQLQDVFDAIFLKYVEQEERLIHFDSIYSSLVQSILNVKTRGETRFWYNYKMAIYKQKKNYVNPIVLAHLEECMKYYSEKEDLKSMLVNTKMLNIKEDYIPEYGVLELRAFADKYTFLKDNSKYKSYLSSLIADVGVELFDDNQIDLGLARTFELDTFCLEYQKVDLVEKNTVSMYDRGAYAYVRKSNKNEALAILNRGLKIFPENAKLKETLKFIKSLHL